MAGIGLLMQPKNRLVNFGSSFLKQVYQEYPFPMMYDNTYQQTIFEPVFTKAVPKYLSFNKKSKQKYKMLYPKCVQIFDNEIQKVEWMDSCFAEMAYWLLKDAHVSQLQSFYCRYCRTSKKTVFFARWVRDEL
jgi:hypothetical protein